MMKRPRDIYDTPVSSTPPYKRIRFDPGTSSPSRYRISASSPYSDISLFNTPYSYPIPSDSPSNPFGLKRTLAALTLPRATGFAKHLALRFQLVHEDKKLKGKAMVPAVELEDVYRIVQVPTNYTFRHLHKLVLFLFASDARWEKPRGSTTTVHHHRRSERLRALSRTHTQAESAGPSDRESAGPSQDKGKGRLEDGPGPSASISADVPPNWAGHVFEVRDDVALYRSGYKPGVMRPYVGRTRVRLSSVRDRKLFPDLYESTRTGTPTEDEDVFSGPSTSRAPSVVGPDTQTPAFEDDDDDEAGWRWEAEDDYTIRHVWPHGPALERGIIYHHLPGTSIHITINTTRVPPRKGIGNQPYVFRWRGSARGAIRIAHVVPRNAPRVRSEPSNRTPSAVHGVFEDERESEERRLRKWNQREAFARFLAREGDRERALLRPLAEGSRVNMNATSNPLDSSPTRPTTDTDRPQVSPLPPSSPPQSSPATLPYLFSASRSVASTASSYSSRRSSAISLSVLSMSSLPAHTPGPAHPALARRVARVSRRLERLTKSGLADMSGSSDEEEVDELEGDELEVDELEGDELFAEDQSDGLEQSDMGLTDDEGCGAGVHYVRGTQWVGKGREEDWDPFGEEEV